MEPKRQQSGMVWYSSWSCCSASDIVEDKDMEMIRDVRDAGDEEQDQAKTSRAVRLFENLRSITNERVII